MRPQLLVIKLLGSKIVTQNFELDTGQRDNIYDIARIVRKPNGVVTPSGRLLVVFDFSHMVL